LKDSLSKKAIELQEEPYLSVGGKKLYSNAALLMINNVTVLKSYSDEFLLNNSYQVDLSVDESCKVNEHYQVTNKPVVADMLKPLYSEDIDYSGKAYNYDILVDNLKEAEVSKIYLVGYNESGKISNIVVAITTQKYDGEMALGKFFNDYINPQLIGRLDFNYGKQGSSSIEGKTVNDVILEAVGNDSLFAYTNDDEGIKISKMNIANGNCTLGSPVLLQALTQ
jgi:hypothetical protein